MIRLIVSPIVTLEQPKDIFNLNIRYPLIYPFSYANIYFDKNRYEIFYRVIEPELNEKERKILYDLEEVIKRILFIDFSKLENLKSTIDYLERLYNFSLNELGIKLPEDSYNKIFYYIFRDIYGYGKIDPLMRDIFIEDIECSGVGIPVYVVHRIFGNLETNIIFNDEKELIDLIEKFSIRSGRTISYADPILDATLPDGSRVNATYSKDVTSRGPTFTIRKFRESPWTITELIKNNSVSPEILAYLWIAVEYKRNIMIIGGTSSGKTTFLNTIAFFIPPNDRIISIEDTRELKLYHKNWIPSVVRYSSGSNKEIDMFTLLKESFRQNPNYVIVGEVRGEEAYVMFQGMASGHAALSTMHATSVKQLMERLTTPPINLQPSLIELLDIVVSMEHEISQGKNIRRVKRVDEIITKDKYHPAFKYDHKLKRYLMAKKFYVFYKISKEFGVDYDELLNEFYVRTKVIENIYRRNIINPEEISKIISLYYLNRDYVKRMFNIE